MIFPFEIDIHERSRSMFAEDFVNSQLLQAYFVSLTHQIEITYMQTKSKLNTESNGSIFLEAIMLKGWWAYMWPTNTNGMIHCIHSEIRERSVQHLVCSLMLHKHNQTNCIRLTSTQCAAFIRKGKLQIIFESLEVLWIFNSFYFSCFEPKQCIISSDWRNRVPQSVLNPQLRLIALNEQPQATRHQWKTCRLQVMRFKVLRQFTAILQYYNWLNWSATFSALGSPSNNS